MAVNRVVAAIDFSSEADLALTHAVAIARRHGAALTIVYVEPNISDEHHMISGNVAGAVELAEVAAEAERAANLELERRVAIASADGIDTDGVLRAGSPDEEIVAVAADLGAELTVIGTHGRTGVRRFLLGSIAERVVERTPEAALVARGAAPDDGGYRRVLVATDFSDAALAALRIAIALAAPDAQLDVMHASQDPIGAEAEASAAALVREAGALGRSIEVTMHQGAAAATIAEVADRGHHDLIALGTHGLRGVRRFLAGSVAEAVVRHARATVVVAHAPTRS